MQEVTRGRGRRYSAPPVLASDWTTPASFTPAIPLLLLCLLHLFLSSFSFSSYRRRCSSSSTSSASSSPVPAASTSFSSIGLPSTRFSSSSSGSRHLALSDSARKNARLFFQCTGKQVRKPVVGIPGFLLVLRENHRRLESPRPLFPGSQASRNTLRPFVAF